MKKRYWAGGILLLILCALCIAVFFGRASPAAELERETQISVAEREKADTSGKPFPSQSTLPPQAPPPYESPIDFQSLQEMNPDIYAWLYIPGTEINYPLLQREDDDSFYLDHNSAGESAKQGALFTEGVYNSKDFMDPVTIIYGHHMRSGEMFGNLQALYSAEGGLDEFGEIIIYLPESELHYQAFAGVPYNKKHILAYHDFENPDVFQTFVEEALSVRSLNAVVNNEADVSPEDQLLILSTCLQGNNQRRYLLLASLQK